MTDLRLRWLLAQERGEEFEGLDGELDGLARLLLLARPRRYEPGFECTLQKRLHGLQQQGLISKKTQHTWALFREALLPNPTDFPSK